MRAKLLARTALTPEIPRGDGGMLAARPLPVVAPADDERAGLLVSLRSLIIRLIDAAEHELG